MQDKENDTGFDPKSLVTLPEFSSETHQKVIADLTKQHLMDKIPTGQVEINAGTKSANALTGKNQVTIS